jgi:broad specificity phosphatase PhoE
VGTAEEIVCVVGGEVRIDPRLRETRGGDRWDERHRELAARYVAGEALPGWEPQAEAVARSDAALRDAAATAAGPVGVVTHGRLLALWLASTAALPDPAAFWDALRYPDAWQIELDLVADGWRVLSPPARVGG